MKHIAGSVYTSMSEVFPINMVWDKGEVLLPLFSSIVLGYVITRGQVNQSDLKLNGTYQLSVYADGIIIYV